MDESLKEGAAKGPRKRILIVDDDRDVTVVLVRILEESGFAAWAVNNPLEALPRAAEVHPDLIILDFDMPKLLGSELSVLLKSDSRTQGIPVLFLSGMTEPDHHMIARLSGAAAYLDKPINPNQLVDKIRELLRPRGES